MHLKRHIRLRMNEDFGRSTVILRKKHNVTLERLCPSSFMSVHLLTQTPTHNAFLHATSGAHNDQDISLQLRGPQIPDAIPINRPIGL